MRRKCFKFYSWRILPYARARKGNRCWNLMYALSIISAAANIIVLWRLRSPVQTQRSTTLGPLHESTHVAVSLELPSPSNDREGGGQGIKDVVMKADLSALSTFSGVAESTVLFLHVFKVCSSGYSARCYFKRATGRAIKQLHA